MKKNTIAAYPYVIWMGIFIILPLLLIILFSFTTTTDTSQMTFTLDNYKEALSPMNLEIIWKSIKLAMMSAFLCFVIGYPVALILSSMKGSRGATLLFLLVAPMWMNFLLRTFGWLNLLERNGIINSILVTLGFQRKEFLYTDGAVLLGMVYNYLPFMILPIHTSLVKMDKSIIEAAQDLGANYFNVFTRVIFPLSLPGVISGITMVFMPAVTTFIISTLLGGGQYYLIGNLIQRMFLGSNEWNLGSALSVILMIIILITMGIFEKVDKASAKDGGALM